MKKRVAINVEVARRLPTTTREQLAKRFPGAAIFAAPGVPPGSVLIFVGAYLVGAASL